MFQGSFSFCSFIAKHVALIMVNEFHSKVAWKNLRRIFSF